MPGQAGHDNLLVDRNVLIDILATDQGVVEEVAEHGDNEPVAVHVTSSLRDEVLDERHDTTTNDEHHEYSGSGLGVLAESLDRQVENGTPHEGSAKTAENEEQAAERNLEH